MKESQNMQELRTQKPLVKRSALDDRDTSNQGQIVLERKNLVIGIDTGVKTGFAVWDLIKKDFLIIKTVKIHDAILYIEYNKPSIAMVVVEDARKAVYGRNNKKDYSKAKGAGSIMRDAKVMEDFLKDRKIPYRMARPNKNITKWDEDKFKRLTGWKYISSEHSRDAGLLVYDYKLSPYEKQL